ncbi:MAG: rhomboid family intramembrane serine protease [Bacteroidetes bacterium]|nr:rhomboid family intramembrane serine protease [Bacteroidota bacterium]
MNRNQSYGRRGFMGMPPVVLNLIIINALLLFLTVMFQEKVDLYRILGLHYFASPNFASWQFVSYMFMHGGFTHLLFNMFALWMFGTVLENVWGPKRFLTFYMITGIGAGLVQVLVAFIRVQSLESVLTPELIDYVYNYAGPGFSYKGKITQETFDSMGMLYNIINTPTVGASGAVFGILLAFGMMFPNSLIYVFFAIPVKAKFFVIFYGVAELYFGVTGTQDGVAHFAHLGGMLFGFFLIKYWKKKGVY